MMPKKAIILIILLLVAGFVLVAGSVSAAANLLSASTPEVTATPRAATEEELDIAYAEWAKSRHADTYDEGVGANTTCAKCKSPTNWDPDNLSQEEQTDCYACKRIPGDPRPDLAEGVPVTQSDWMSIGCEICHEPIGDSYSIEISFWEPGNQYYRQIKDTKELCGKCHEGVHGFEVIDEQDASSAHNQWECTKCHGNHGAPSACTDCHNPETSTGATEHDRHPSVNCTACHDDGKLGIWLEESPLSKHFEEYVTRRFAHSLASWPSHNLTKEVDCKRCHHPPNMEKPVLIQEIGCPECHEQGAVLYWCDFLPRNGNPNAIPLPGSIIDEFIRHLGNNRIR